MPIGKGAGVSRTRVGNSSPIERGKVMTASTSRSLRLLPAALLMAAWLVGCSGDGGNGSGPTPAALAAARAGSSGDGQTGAAGHDLGSPLQIVVTRDGAPAQGAVVTWAATGTGASM